MFQSDLSVGCNAFMFMVSFLAVAHATAFRSRIGRARRDELEWEHVFEFRTGLPGRVNAGSGLFGLDEVGRLLNAEFLCIFRRSASGNCSTVQPYMDMATFQILLRRDTQCRTKGHFFGLSGLK